MCISWKYSFRKRDKYSHISFPNLYPMNGNVCLKPNIYQWCNYPYRIYYFLFKVFKKMIFRSITSSVLTCIWLRTSRNSHSLLNRSCRYQMVNNLQIFCVEIFKWFFENKCYQGYVVRGSVPLEHWLCQPKYFVSKLKCIWACWTLLKVVTSYNVYFLKIRFVSLIIRIGQKFI